MLLSHFLKTNYWVPSLVTLTRGDHGYPFGPLLGFREYV